MEDYEIHELDFRWVVTPAVACQSRVSRNAGITPRVEEGCCSNSFKYLIVFIGFAVLGTNLKYVQQANSSGSLGTAGRAICLFEYKFISIYIKLHWSPILILIPCLEYLFRCAQNMCQSQIVIRLLCMP